jgi:hypothetical protein
MELDKLRLSTMTQILFRAGSINKFTMLGMHVNKLSRGRGFVTNNNGIWIGFIDTFFYNIF